MFFLKINFHNSASWFFIFLHHFIRRFLLTSDTVRVCLTLCLLIPWEWSLIGIVLTENVLELVVWNYLQFDSQFAVFLTVWFKILSPLSLMILFLPPLERFFILPPSLYFFHKPRNYWLIHRKIFQPIYKCIWFFTSYIYKSIACLLCFSDSFCRLPFTVHSDKNEEFIQMGTKNCVQGVIMPHLNWPKQHCCKKKIGNVEFHL